MMRWLLLLLLLLATDPPARSEEVGAKAMFHDPSLNVIHFSPRREGTAKTERVPSPSPHSLRTPSAPGGPVPLPAPQSGPMRSIGIRVWVQRVDEHGKVLTEAAVGNIFRNGERIQLVVESNTAGYLAVVQQGSNGRAGLLFPPHESELGSNRVQAHDKVVLPGARYSFAFDQVAGTERLLIVLVRDQQELAALPLRRDMELTDLAAVRRLANRELGAKNLIMQAFADPLDDPAIYAVNLAGSAVVQEIALVHEK